jgi:hypothetical protein
MPSFWNSLESGFSSATNFIGDTVHQGFTDFSNIAKTAEGTVKDVADKGFSTVNSAVSGVVDLGKNAENKVAGIAGGFEDILAVPLILIAGFVGYFLISKNGSQAISVAGDIAMKKL